MYNFSKKYIFFKFLNCSTALIIHFGYDIIVLMVIETIKITDFRNYRHEKITLSPGINIFTGKNAQGKTNLLEAVCLCSLGKSPRTPRDREMIRRDASKADILLELKDGYQYDKVEIVLSHDSNKRVAVGGLPVSRIGELMGIVPTVFFSPDELKIVKNSPSDRRRFMDISLCQISRPYFYTLTKFNNVLNQRNKLLKDRRTSRDAIEVWDIQLAEYGSKITKSRKGFCKILSDIAAQKHELLTGGREKLNLEYEGLDGNNESEIYDEFIRLLGDSVERDIAMGYTHIGPHKDDIKISIDGTDLRSYGSQGQQRTAALSMKLSEMEIIKQNLFKTPVLLLDDVLSELDSDRCNRLLNSIGEFQSIITCTDLPPLPVSSKVFEIQSGKVVNSYILK